VQGLIRHFRPEMEARIKAYVTYLLSVIPSIVFMPAFVLCVLTNCM
jgi:hypothetical protein